MDKMKTLTVNGKTYEICDPSAPRIDNETVGDSPWSSKHTVDRLCPALEEQGAVVACEPVEGYPLRVVSRIEPVQSGSGDPSPQNIRPITGHTAANLVRSGKNLLDPNKINTTICTFDETTGLWSTTNATGYFRSLLTGEAGMTSNRDVSKLLKLPSNTYVTIKLNDWSVTLPEGVSASEIDSCMRYAIYNEKGEFVYNPPSAPIVSTFVTPDIPHCFLDIRRWSVDYGVSFRSIQVEIGDTATEYEPYRGEEFSIELGQTVYGGSYDWESGMLTLDKALLTLTGTENWSIQASTTDHFQVKTPVGNIFGKNDGICSHFTVVGVVDLTKLPQIRPSVNTKSLWYEDALGSYGSVEEFKMYLAEQYAAGTPVQLCYEMETPVTVQLTPREVLALSGENVLFSDTGDTAVTGRADLAAVMEKLQNAIISLGGNV